MPITGNQLVVEPSFAFAKAFNGEINDITMKEEREYRESVRDPELAKLRVRNQFWSSKLRCDVVVLQHEETGKISWRFRPQANHGDELLATLHASDVWGVDQEQAALQTLAGMLPHRHFKQYLLTGMFLEKSKRSHIPYLFRRLRPTLALGSIRPDEENDRSQQVTILAALCMHPIAYYAGSWAGAMCPTDDVIAHLSMMRGDEHMFWKRCNQHQAYRPQAGV